MNSFIRTTIRALAAPDHRLSCPRALWSTVLRELARRGEGRHEAGAFLLGQRTRARRQVTHAIYYDELDPLAYRTGVCVLEAPAFAQLWAACRARRCTVVADVHTHVGEPYQSEADRTNPMVAQAGHVALIVPNLAWGALKPSDLGVYEYQGNHRWRAHLGRAAGRYFYVGRWS